ncbi:PREDICTED: C-C motif chemokine 18-like isoform X1 [Cyprinodon variegatus]|uniref:C-C motif chemokine 18-like isoform X1 n=1 Tax=Cyprinodon variegatus TaxID=28743 RepID=UPI000742A717|nr:PREDICTED: C-C motif chemokine 18-like isoform X1 [Cyprinodon variegatus]
MAPFGDAKLFFGIFFIVCCFSVTMAEVAVDCCLSVKNRELDKRLFVDYREQAKGCTIDATILVTRLGKQLCVPTKEEKWVQVVMKHVDHLKKICKKLNYKSKRCTGMKPE